MLLREFVEKYRGIEVKDLRELLKIADFYEDLGYQYQNDFYRIKEQIQLGRTPKLDLEEIRG